MSELRLGGKRILNDALSWLAYMAHFEELDSAQEGLFFAKIGKRSKTLNAVDALIVAR